MKGKTMRKTLLLLLILGTASIVSAQEGPPCWDKIPPSQKYAQTHVVSGDTAIVAPPDSETTHRLSVDGVNVTTKMTDGEAYIEVEVVITNCSAKTLEINPRSFNLSVLDPMGTRILTPLDATQIVRDAKTGRRFPATAPQTIPYGRIAYYLMFFARDGNAKSSDFLHSNYRLSCSIPIGGWQFDFTFPRIRR
jgi:hypothetical protein